MVDPTGPPCPCGRRGCWERYASGAGLARMARDAAEAGRLDDVLRPRSGGDAAAIRGEDVVAAARTGDAEAAAIMADCAWWTAVGVANLVAVLDPEVVVLGGGLIDAADLWLDETRRRLPGARGGLRPPHAAARSRPPSTVGGRRRSGAALLARDPGLNVPGAAAGAPLPSTPMEFRRITSLPPYVFTIIDGLKVELRREGVDVVDLGFGNPDLPSPEVAVAKLAEAAQNPRNHRYSSSRGIPKLRQAVADLYERRFGVAARPRPRGHQHHRGQGGLLPPDVGAARPGRRLPRAVAVVPDPHLGAAVRRGRRPRGAG